MKLNKFGWAAGIFCLWATSGWASDTPTRGLSRDWIEVYHHRFDPEGRPNLAGITFMEVGCGHKILAIKATVIDEEGRQIRDETRPLEEGDSMLRDHLRAGESTTDAKD